MRKQLKLPPSMYPKTAKVMQQKSEEDVIDLLMKLNERLIDTEQAMEKSLREKQGESTSKPSKVIPIVKTAVPSKTASDSAPNVPTPTKEIITGTKIAPTTPEEDFLKYLLVY